MVRRSKRKILACHVIPRFGDRRVDSITRRDVDDWVRELVTGRKPKTVNNILTTLGALLTFAARRGEIKERPRVELLHVPPQPFEFLEEDQLDTLLSPCDATERAAALLAADAGLRIGEVLALRWVDVDHVSGKLVVRRAVYYGVESSPKGKRERVVPMTARLAEALEGVRGPGAWVIHRGDGAPWTVEVARTTGHRLYTRVRASVPAYPWHTLRHTFGARLARAGAPAKAIQELMGHASLTTTLRYMHLSPSALQEAVSLLERSRG